MIVLNDLATIQAASVLAHHELRPLISSRIDELADCGVTSIQELVNFVVIEPRDTLTAIEEALGIDIMHRPVDVIECHPNWYELTYVLSDDGFGLVVYVPIRDVDPQLSSLCLRFSQAVNLDL